MKKKHHQLISYLNSKNGEFVSSTVLAEILNVTDRSIRNYVKEINSNPASGIVISSSPQGYKLRSNHQNDEYKKGDEYGTNLENELLEFRIIQFLMNQREYISYDEIANIFFYSSQTIRSRVQKLTVKIHELGVGVDIDTKVFRGIKLAGTEVQKRILLELFFTNIFIKKEVFRDLLMREFSEWLEKPVLKKIFHTVDKINTELHLSLEFLMYKKLITQLVIIVHQINTGHQVVIEQEQLEKVEVFKEFEVAKKLQQELSDCISMDDKEILFLVNYLISLQLGLGKISIVGQDEDILTKIQRILFDIEEIYHVETYSKKRFRESITEHIYRIIHPASQNILLYNPYIKEAKTEYFFSFSIASNIALKLEKEFDLEIQDSEIAYLAYHIQVILESQDKKKIKTIILFNRNYERIKLLASKLVTYFDELEIVRIEKYTNTFQFEEKYLYIGIDLIDAAIELQNFINIGYKFQKSEIKKIDYFLESQNSILEKVNIYRIEANTPETAIKELLFKDDQSHMLEPILKRERMSYTSIGNLVAIPHSYLDNQKYQEKIIIGILEKPILWGAENVQLILIYIPSSDIRRNEYVFQEFYQKTKDLEAVRELIKTKNKQEFIQRWNTI
ncbi:BglG family transcription antiterminator [Enterococcus olivae]